MSSKAPGKNTILAVKTMIRKGWSNVDIVAIYPRMKWSDVDRLRKACKKQDQQSKEIEEKIG